MLNFSMVILVPIVLFLSIQFKINVISPLQPAANFLHSHCVNLLTPADRSQDLSASFICGKKVTHHEQKILLQKSGLYHAIVVSGGHFLFLETLTKRLSWPYPIRWFMLLVYYIATNLQAPGLRCLMQMGLSRWIENRNTHISPPSLCFYSGLICLTLNWELWTSLSFWLSLTVSLALAFARELKTQNLKLFSFFLPLVCIYIFLFPFNFTGGYLHPLNLILGTIFLYPFCIFLLFGALVVFVERYITLPVLNSVWDNLNDLVFRFLKLTTEIIPLKNSGRIDSLYLWIYLLSLTLAFHMLILRFRQKTIHE